MRCGVLLVPGRVVRVCGRSFSATSSADTGLTSAGDSGDSCSYAALRSALDGFTQPDLSDATNLITTLDNLNSEIASLDLDTPLNDVRHTCWKLRWQRDCSSSSSAVDGRR